MRAARSPGAFGHDRERFHGGAHWPWHDPDGLTLVWMISVRPGCEFRGYLLGLGFALLAWLYCFLSAALTPRSWLVAALITLWGTRLSVDIFRRHHGKGEDPRYQAMRASHGPEFWWRSLFIVFWLQGAILWFVALPLLVAVRAARPAALTTVDGLGVVLFTLGFGFEVVGDHQLERFRAEPSNRGHVLDRGLWRTRGIPTTSETPPCGGACIHRRRNDWRMAHRAEPGPHDLLADTRVRGDAARERPESLEARLLRIHHPHAGLRPLGSARAAVTSAFDVFAKGAKLEIGSSGRIRTCSRRAEGEGGDELETTWGANLARRRESWLLR